MKKVLITFAILAGIVGSTAGLKYSMVRGDEAAPTPAEVCTMTVSKIQADTRKAQEAGVNVTLTEYTGAVARKMVELTTGADSDPRFAEINRVFIGIIEDDERAWIGLATDDCLHASAVVPVSTARELIARADGMKAKASDGTGI